MHEHELISGSSDSRSWTFITFICEIDYCVRHGCDQTAPNTIENAGPLLVRDAVMAQAVGVEEEATQQRWSVRTGQQFQVVFEPADNPSQL